MKTFLAICRAAWAFATDLAPANPSGCGNGGMCRGCTDCPDLHCEGHPRNGA